MTARNGHHARMALGATQRGKEAVVRQRNEALLLLEEVCGAAKWDKVQANEWGERYAALLADVGEDGP